MKKLLLASAVAALSVTAANAAPTIYGKAFLTLDASSSDTDTTIKATATTPEVKLPTAENKNRAALNSNGSRIGFKGSEALTGNTDLVYQLEYGINVAENTPQFTSRDTYLGLSNAQLGTLVAGRLTAIDDEVDYANVTTGGVLYGDGVLAWTADRANNAFAYASPDYNGMQVMAMYVMDENKATDSFGRDVFGIGAKYEQGPMRAGATYIGAGDDLKAFRVSGGYDISPIITVGGLYQMTDFDTDDNENAFTISGEMKTATPWTAYAQGDMVSNADGAKNADKFRAVVGGKYAFNKATTGHVYGAFGKIEEEDAVQKVETTGFGVGGGIEYKF